MATNKNTVNILNSEIIRSTIDAKQGEPMSCILCIIYLNVLAIMMKLIGDDSPLRDIHMLMLMDDTVLFGTSREMIVRKFTTLMVFCERYGMVMK